MVGFSKAYRSKHVAAKLVLLVMALAGMTSAAGQGSTFWVELPFPLATSTAGQSSDQTPPGPTSTVRSRFPQALVVEDHPINQMLTVRLLEHFGYQVAVATNGVEAVALCQRRNFDVIFMDCHMPEMDGYAATAEIRSLETASRRHTPIVSVTARAMRGDRERCLAAGMDDYLSKPISLAELARTLRLWAKGDPKPLLLVSHAHPGKETTH